MLEQDKIIKCLTAFFRRDINRVRGAALIGSFGRGQGSSTSDIDIEVLLTNDQFDIEQLTNELLELFHQTNESSLFVKHTLWLADQRKLALYHGPQLLLTELYLYTHLSQFDKYFLGSRIRDLSKCILVDPENVIRRHFQHLLTLPYDDRQSLLRELISNIQFHLESTSTARKRHDAYKFYFLSNITLHELLRLAYILDGNIEYNYNPPQLTVARRFASTMDLNQSGNHLKKLIDFFFEQLDRMKDNEKTFVDKTRQFCQDLLQRESLE